MERLRTYWQKFISCFICVMLMHLSFTVNIEQLKFSFSNSAHAETTTETKTYSNSTTGESGSVKLNANDGFMNTIAGPAVSLLVFIAAALIIYKLATTCKPIDYDIYGAAAGAGIFLMGELMSIFGSKQDLEAKTLEYTTNGEDGKIDDEQYQALLKEKEAMDGIAKAADKRSKYQSAAAVVFAASAAWALTREAKKVALKGSCMTAAEGSTCCAAPVTSTILKRSLVEEVPAPSMSLIPEFLTLDSLLGTYNKTCMTTTKAALVAAQAAVPVSTLAVSVALKEFNATLATESACTMYIAENAQSEAACVLSTNPLFGYNKSNEFDLMEIFFPTAYAAGFMGALGAIVGAISGYYLSQSLYINSLITTPKHRAYLWGGLSAFGFLVSKNTKETANEARENSKKIAAILEKMDNSRQGVSVTSNVASNSLANAGTQIALGSNLGTVPLSDTMPCMNGSTKKDDGTVVCNPNKFSTNSNFSGLGFPSGLAPIMASAGTVVGSTQGTDSVPASADASVDDINASQNAVATALKKAKDNLNKTLVQNGKKAVDFDKEQKGLMKGLVKRMQSDLAKNNQTPFGLLRSMGMSAPTTSEKEEASNVAGAGAPVPDVKVGGGEGLSAEKNGLDFSFATPSSDDLVAQKEAEFAANAAAAADEGEVKNDIIKDKNENLFKVISIRYKKSFGRLLDEL